MSGHSHAKTIKHQKNIIDQKRGKMFSKIARVISVAVKEGGSNPEINTKLRMVVEMAKNFNMPRENVDRAIQRAAGGTDSEILEEVSFEAYGPGGIAIIIEGITDNKNRSLGEIKQILNQNGGKLVAEGSVRWLFEKKGCIVIDLNLQKEDWKNKERLETTTIDIGAQDLYWHGDSLNVYTKIEELEKVKNFLEERGVKIEMASLDWVAKEMINLNEEYIETCQKLFEALDESEAVQEIYSNIKLP